MLRSIGITEQRVDRSTAEILRDFYGLTDKAYASVAEAAYAKDPTLVLRQSDRNLDYEKDPRDHSTPKAMLELLLAIDSGKILSEKSREFLLGTMSRTRTGGGRLRGLLPKGTPVAHKTGTIGGVANDVGFITLPDGRRFAIAVFTKSSTTSEADRDRAIAEVTRALYDFYYLKSQDKYALSCITMDCSGRGFAPPRQTHRYSPLPLNRALLVLCAALIALGCLSVSNLDLGEPFESRQVQFSVGLSSATSVEQLHPQKVTTRHRLRSCLVLRQGRTPAQTMPGCRRSCRATERPVDPLVALPRGRGSSMPWRSLQLTPRRVTSGYLCGA